LTNPVSQARYHAFGPVERLHLRYVQAYFRRARLELVGLKKQGGLSAREHAALHADVQYWRDQIEALQRLADVQSYAAVSP
jgi:hypothetical protein